MRLLVVSLRLLALLQDRGQVEYVFSSSCVKNNINRLTSLVSLTCAAEFLRLHYNEQHSLLLQGSKTTVKKKTLLRVFFIKT